jgi:hypothetical protein
MAIAAKQRIGAALRELANLDAGRGELHGGEKLSDPLNAPGRMAGAIVRKHIVVRVFLEKDNARIVGADIARHIALARLVAKRFRNRDLAFDAGGVIPHDHRVPEVGRG